MVTVTTCGLGGVIIYVVPPGTFDVSLASSMLVTVYSPQQCV
jgi:hypothetical protein